MKKLIALLMVSAMVLSLVSLVGCQTTPATLKLGLGVSVSASGSDATAEENGEDKLTVTAAAVLNGKALADGTFEFELFYFNRSLWRCSYELKKSLKNL